VISTKGASNWVEPAAKVAMGRGPILYGDDIKATPHKYIEKGHYMTVMGDSASAGKAIVFETDGQQVTMFRSGRLPEVQWVEACS